MAAEGHAPTAGEYIVHHLTHLSTGKPKGLVDFSVVNWDSVFFSIAIGVLGCWLLWLARTQGDVRRARALPGRRRDAVRAGRQRGEEHRPQRDQPQVRGPARAHGVRLGVPAERDGPAAGRPAADHLGLDLRRRRPRPGARLPARRADGRPVDHDGPLGRRAAAGPLLQHQDQGARRLAARAAASRRSATSRSPPTQSAGSSFC